MVLFIILISKPRRHNINLIMFYIIFCTEFSVGRRTCSYCAASNCDAFLTKTVESDDNNIVDYRVRYCYYYDCHHHHYYYCRNSQVFGDETKRPDGKQNNSLALSRRGALSVCRCFISTPSTTDRVCEGFRNSYKVYSFNF